MADLLYSPTVKKEIKEELYNYIYGPVQKAFRKRLDEIIHYNTLKLGNGYRSFVHRNELYQMDPPDPLPPRMNRLHPSLSDEMNEYLRELEEINDKEIPYVIGFLTNVLNSSNSIQDYFSLFPDVIHQPLKQTIKTCPCTNGQLTAEDMNSILVRNTRAIELMKKRMMLNLIL